MQIQASGMPTVAYRSLSDWQIDLLGASSGVPVDGGSGLGIIVGGIVLGIAETTTGFYLSTGYKDVPGLVLLLLVLAFKPAGLFGKTAIKKV
jgi:hypothetical protein